MHACMHVHTNTCLVEREIERGGGVWTLLFFFAQFRMGQVVNNVVVFEKMY